MSVRTSPSARTSSSRSISPAKRTLMLGGLGVVSLVIGGLALRSAYAEEPQAASAALRREVLSNLKEALIAGQSALIELDAVEKKPVGHRDGDGGTDGRRRTGDTAKVAQLARTAAGKVARAGELLGTARLEGLDVAATVKGLKDVAARATTATTAAKDLQAVQDALAAQLASVEIGMEDVETPEGSADDLTDETAEEAGDTWYEPSLLTGVFAFVFLNFGLLVVQTLRSKETPKIVLDTLTMSASFLIGTGTSSLMS